MGIPWRSPWRAAVLSAVTVTVFGFWWWFDVNRQLQRAGGLKSLSNGSLPLAARGFAQAEVCCWRLPWPSALYLCWPDLCPARLDGVAVPA